MVSIVRHRNCNCCEVPSSLMVVIFFSYFIFFYALSKIPSSSPTKNNLLGRHPLVPCSLRTGSYSSVAWPMGRAIVCFFLPLGLLINNGASTPRPQQPSVAKVRYTEAGEISFLAAVQLPDSSFAAVFFLLVFILPSSLLSRHFLRRLSTLFTFQSEYWSLELLASLRVWLTQSGGSACSMETRMMSRDSWMWSSRTWWWHMRRRGKNHCALLVWLVCSHPSLLLQHSTWAVVQPEHFSNSNPQLKIHLSSETWKLWFQDFWTFQVHLDLGPHFTVNSSAQLN